MSNTANNHGHTPGFTCLGILNDLDVAYGYTYDDTCNVFSLVLAIREEKYIGTWYHTRLYYDLSRAMWAGLRGFSESEAIEEFGDPTSSQEVKKYLLKEAQERLKQDLRDFKEGWLKDKDRIPI